MPKKNRSSKINYRENSLKLLVASLTGMGSVAYAVDLPFGLVGGQDASSNSYSAFISQKNVLIPISSLPADGNSVINAVALNASGNGLIAGRTGFDGYAAFVNTNGVVTPFTIPFANGSLNGAGISGSGLGLVSGLSVSNTPYVAHLSTDGTITPITVSLDVIQTQAMNDAGVGMIGGEGSAIAYAGYIAADGTVTQVLTPSSAPGHIYTVSLNNQGNGIIGGHVNFTNYAALVTPDGAANEITTTASGSIFYASAINSSGTALIGGSDAAGNAYLGYVTPSGDVTPLFDTPFLATINHAAINDSGAGIVSGDTSGIVYAALVAPNGDLTPLFTSSVSGAINSVAINKEGIVLIGGSIPGGSLALVAPNGTVTALDAPTGSMINSVAILNGSKTNPILDKVVPSSMGPYASAIYTQLAVNSALDARLIQKNKVWSRKYANNGKQKISFNENSISSNEGLLAYNGDNIAPSQNYLAYNPKTKSAPKGKTQPSNPNSIWLEPFGNYTHLKKQGSTPSYTNEVGGALLGYDREESNYIVGATIGYAFNYIQYSQGIGHGKIQEEMTSVYGSYYTDHFWIASAVWGGLYQFNNTRHTLSQITSKGHTHGWILAPHLEMASPWSMGNTVNYYVEPFVSLDWVNNWQGSFTETGASGLNLKIPSVYDSLLQSEVGLRFYERFEYNWGDFCLEEKLSYVNQAPFDFDSVTTSFVSSASSFPIGVGSSKVQNLGAFQLLGAFISKDNVFSGGFSFQVTAGSAYQSYFGSLFAGFDF